MRARIGRPQLTLRGILLSMTWVAVLLAAWGFPADHLKNQAYQALLLGLYALRIISIFPAIGALFGRATLFFGIGCVVFLLIVVGLLVMLFVLAEPTYI